MQYLTLSFTHKNTDIKIREKLSFSSDEKLKSMLSMLYSFEGINEVMILSTCNRVEIITSVKESIRTLAFMFKVLSVTSGIDKEELEGRADIYEGNGAIHHLFSVGSSLDSLVVGETQIMGQLKNAYRFSLDNGFCGLKLGRAMHHCFKCAAEIRNSTNISKNPISVSSVAVAKAKELFGDLSNINAVVVGAGEMAELAAKHLIASNANVIFVSRSIENAKILALKLGEKASVQPFSQLKKLVNEYTLLFSATSSTQTVISLDIVEARDFSRYWFDIAVPRDIEPTSYENIHIFAVDDLEEMVARNMALREEEAKIAYTIVGKMTFEFFKWLQTLLVDPIIKEIREKAKVCATSEVSKAVKKGYISAEHEEEVTKIIHQVFNAFLHKPTVNLKNISELPQADTIVQSIQYFFDLNDDSTNVNSYKCEYQMEKDI